MPRWQKIAKQYRELAVSMGGVLIKLGQFLSVRIDILPLEITDELAGLQDEVPPVPFDQIRRQLEEDFGGPIHKTFSQVSPHPLGSASLAQAHEVILLNGEPAVIKVLRPGIHRLVETDLAVISKAFGWLKFFRKIRQRVDMDWLADEFSAVTRRELDLTAEGKNAERIARDFSDNPYVLIPKIYWQYCRLRTLTLEKVDYIKINDKQTLRASGIRCEDIADKLYQIYMQQVFETFFVHVDPHPGNLFVKPLPDPQEKSAGQLEFKPGDPVPFKQGRSFKLVFIDFGMVASIPERLRTALRLYAIGIGTQDPAKIVQAYVDAGALPADADLVRIEEAHRDLFHRLWGVRVGQFKDLALKEAKYFIKQYRDVIYDAPFQFQVDMLFVVRAVGILSGLATFLDPQFDPWEKTVPYAERFAKANLWEDWKGLPRELQILIHAARHMPSRLDRLLSQAIEGRISVDTHINDEKMNALESWIRKLSWTIMASALAICGAIIQSAGNQNFPWGFYLLAVIFFLKGLKKT